MSAEPVSRRWGESPGELTVHDVHLQRGERTVLQAVSLRAQPGRLLALVGPNGAGKSSLLGVLAGLLAPTQGQAALDGRSLTDWPPATLARRRAMLSQQVRLGFGFRVDEVVMLGRSPYSVHRDDRADRRIVEAALHAAHAWHLRERAYPELSGGEQQRVQLARVLAQVWEGDDGARWLLLDEPEAGLDMAHQHFVLRRARLLACQGYGVVVVLHDLNLAARYADEVALLERGKLLRHGSPEDTLEPCLLSDVYGLPMGRVATEEHGWVLVPV